jgi:hypothetical protein
MAKGTPQEIASKWARSASAGTEAYRAGVQRVQEAPGVAAVRRRAEYVAGVQRSQEKWARNTARVTREEWVARTSEIGAARFGQGVQAAEGKMADFLSDFLPFQDRVAAQVRAMPKGDIEQGIARAAAMIRGTAQYKRGGGR